MRPVLAALLALALAAGAASAGGNCSVTSVARTPLTDLGAGFYQGHQGGLYPGGSNARPPQHESDGLGIANAIAPLDTFGVPDPSGRVVLISIGMSNTTQEFSTFVPLAMGWSPRNPRLLVVDCAQGGQSADKIVDPTAAYWSFVDAKLRLAHSSPAQVQVVWLKEAVADPTGGWPAATDTLGAYLGTIVRLIRAKMPNARLCYLTSRVYAGYATGVSNLNPEPYAYESGFAVKDLIAAQIAGVDSLSWQAGHAPWLSWGPYLWADGLDPRGDGVTWVCDYLQADGTHPSPSGRQVIADSLMRFFSTDVTTTPWFLGSNPAAVAGGAAALEFSVSPNPAEREVEFRFSAPAGVRWRIDVLDPAGRLVGQAANGVGTGGPASVRWSGEDGLGGPLAAGVYWARLTIGARAISKPFVALGGR
jgi:hypothetical protein